MTALPQPAVRGGHPCLVADIGGTNARFGWYGGTGQPVGQVRTLQVAQHAGPAQAARHYLSELGTRLGSAYRAPRRAAFAVATTVDGDRVTFTNSAWSFSRDAVRAELALDELLVLNDFEALALALPRLRPDQWRASGAAPRPQGTLAVIGPGTGLGVGGVIQVGDRWAAIGGEGGHATLAAGDDYESALIARVRREHAHVSAERLLSGIGLPLLHRAVCAQAGAAPSPLASQQIVDQGVAGTDALARQTLEAFCALLGGFAGNVALTLGARSGVFIGGGIVPRLGDLFFTSRFRERFEAKGRFRGYLQQVPTALITDTLAALDGAVAALEQDAAPAACCSQTTPPPGCAP